MINVEVPAAPILQTKNLQGQALPTDGNHEPSKFESKTEGLFNDQALKGYMFVLFALMRAA